MDLSLLYLPSAVVLGALHALEPGHAKTLTAAYLIGTKGTKRDATILGVSVAVTHSFVVVGLSVVAVLLGRETFTDDASHVLAVGSSVVVMALGSWLLLRRMRALRRSKHGGHHHHHSHAPEPVSMNGKSFSGLLSIVDTPDGERFRLESSSGAVESLEVRISRPGGTVEVHELRRSDSTPSHYFGESAPAEPHEFSATLSVTAQGITELIPFEMHEPHHHDDHHHDHHHHEHDHALMSDDEHARAHARNLPEYVKRGERPSVLQIVTFGAAGGLIPCPAAISVMLLSLSLSQTGKGLIMVLGFSIGLAITLVGVGLLVVTGVTKLASSGRLSRLTALAPAIAAAMVIFSGAIGLTSALLTH